MMEQKNVVVIGGGITGLSAAWELQKQSNGHLRITVLEKTNHWGGKIHTKTVTSPEGGRIIIDGGPESFITRKPEVWDLAHEMGIQDQLTDPGSETSHMYVLDDGRMHPVPLSPMAFILSSLMSWGGKLRLLAEPWIPPKDDDGDESLAAFSSRRLGIEAMEKLIAPILGGIYNSDPQRQSILTTAPLMREMETEYGSLFKAAFARIKTARKEKENHKPPRFVSFAGGAQDLVDNLVLQLRADMRLNTSIQEIMRTEQGYQLTLADGGTLIADALILTTPANAAAELLNPLSPEVGSALGRIRHENIGTASLVYRSDEVRLSQRIHGLMIPRREKRMIDAVSFSSEKMPERAAQDYFVVRVFFGGGSPDLVKSNDNELLSTIQDELADLFGIHVKPVDVIFFRWKNSFPQADVGHLDLISAIEQNLPPGIYLAGSSYRGIGVPDCIRQGKQAAGNLYNQLKQSSYS